MNGDNGGSRSGAASLAVLVYGHPRVEKTSQTLAAYGACGLFVGREGAIRLTAENELGFTPSVVEAGRLIPELGGWLEANGKVLVDEGYQALVIDDLTPRMKASMFEWNRDPRAKETKSGKQNTFFVYQQAEQWQAHIITYASWLGIHLAASAHEREPRDGSLGGPLVASYNQGSAIVGMFDVAMRAYLDTDWQDPWMPSMVYAMRGSNTYISGDKTGVVKPTAPFNIREILRAAREPVLLPRIPGLEWQDEKADDVALRLEQGEPARDIAASYFDGVVPETPGTREGLHLRWAIRDGLARGALRMQAKRRASQPSLVGAVASGQATRPSAPLPGPKR